MLLYCSNDFDTESLELLYVYVKKYKIFKEIGFNFTVNTRFSVNKENVFDDNDIFHVNRNDNSNIDLFSKYGINLNIVCGKNGTGKSTLIELLQQP